MALDCVCTRTQIVLVYKFIHFKYFHWLEFFLYNVKYKSWREREFSPKSSYTSTQLDSIAWNCVRACVFVCLISISMYILESHGKSIVFNFSIVFLFTFLLFFSFWFVLLLNWKKKRILSFLQHNTHYLNEYYSFHFLFCNWNAKIPVRIYMVYALLNVIVCVCMYKFCIVYVFQRANTFFAYEFMT